MSKNIMDDLKSLIDRNNLDSAQAENLYFTFGPVLDLALKVAADYLDGEDLCLPSKIESFVASLSASIVTTLVENYITFFQDLDLPKEQADHLRRAMYKNILTLQKVGFSQVCEDKETE